MEVSVRIGVKDTLGRVRQGERRFPSSASAKGKQ